jgi:hypothetical protein
MRKVLKNKGMVQLKDGKSPRKSSKENARDQKHSSRNEEWLLKGIISMTELRKAPLSLRVLTELLKCTEGKQKRNLKNHGTTTMGVIYM